MPGHLQYNVSADYLALKGGQTPVLMNGQGHGEPEQGAGFSVSGHFLQKQSLGTKSESVC